MKQSQEGEIAWEGGVGVRLELEVQYGQNITFG